MPKARTAGQCYLCETDERYRTTFLTCVRCERYFCTDHGSPEFDRCFTCLEAEEEVD
ncbi:hypothetical protein [Candidatus Nitrospira bockiana]